jgi:hypothetical protein
MLPYTFSLPARPTDANHVVSDWMWKAGYDATARPWRRPTLFNSEYTSGVVNTDPLERACAMARESIEWANSNGKAIIHIGVFPDAQAAKLRELILTSHGTIAVIFPPKAFAFTPFLALFGMAKMKKTFFKKGVVLATFRSEFYKKRPSAISKRRMHEWWALHTPTPLVASARWVDPWWCLDGPIPLQGQFLPQWPLVDTYLSWADPQANSRRHKTEPYMEGHPMAELAALTFKETRWTLLGLVPTAFQDLLLSAGVPTGVLSAALKNHTVRTLAWLNIAWISHTATLITEGDARLLANIARKEARLATNPLASSNPFSKPVEIQCYGPPPGKTHRRFAGHRILTPALISDALPQARSNSLNSKPKLPRPLGGIHASAAPPHVLMSNNAGYKISKLSDSGKQAKVYGIDQRIRRHMTPHLNRLWQGGHDPTIPERLWPLTALADIIPNSCVICLTPRTTNAVCDKLVVWHKWGPTTMICKRCNMNYAQQSDWRFLTVIHVCAAAFLIQLGGFPMDANFKSVRNTREARSSTFPTSLEGSLNHLLGPLYDDYRDAHPDTMDPRGPDTDQATDRDSQASLCQPVPIELLMSPSWAIALDIALQWAALLQVPDEAVSNMTEQVMSHTIIQNAQFTARAITQPSATSNHARLAARAASRAYVGTLEPEAKLLHTRQVVRDRLARNRAAKRQRQPTMAPQADPATEPGPSSPAPASPPRPVRWLTRRTRTHTSPSRKDTPPPKRTVTSDWRRCHRKTMTMSGIRLEVPSVQLRVLRFIL